METNYRSKPVQSNKHINHESQNIPKMKYFTQSGNNIQAQFDKQAYQTMSD